jgi:hypothetical protein
MRRLWRKYLEVLDTDLNTQIFDNIKNLLVCALLFAAGTQTLRSAEPFFFSVFAANIAGWGLIAVSAGLMFLSISDGLRRLAKLRYHVMFQIILCLVYLVVALRVVEIVWRFRAG